MIDENLLRELGWSEQLIKAISQVADSLQTPTDLNRGAMPVQQVLALSSTAVYAQSVERNVVRAFGISEE